MWNMFKVNIKGIIKMSNVALRMSLLLTLNIFYTFLHSVSFVEFEQLSAGWQLRYVALLDINRTCMRFANLYDLWCMNLYFISLIPIFMNAYFHGLALTLRLIMCYWHDKSSKDALSVFRLRQQKLTFILFTI